VQGSPTLALGNLELKVHQLTWQLALNKVLPFVTEGVNYMLKIVEGVAEGMVWGLNQKLASEGANTFVVSVTEQMSLNITAPQAPSLDASTDLISVWLDGRFVDASTGQSSQPINDV